MYTIQFIQEVIPHLRSLIVSPSASIQKLVYDSRRIQGGENGLFFALQGVRDGHSFIRDAYEKGIRSFVVSSDSLDVSSYDGANFIWVENALVALQTLAAYHRKQFSIPVVGITGSNGKTIVKEWLFQLISPYMRCYESPKSYNSQLGVALSLWDLQPEHQVALIEAGISREGEMQRLAQMIAPTIGVLTSLGTAHADGFASKARKFDEKAKLFVHADTIVAPAALWKHFAPVDSRCILWGSDSAAEIQILEQASQDGKTRILLAIAGKEQAFVVPFIDQASVDNVLSCIGVMLTLGFQLEVIQERVLTLQPLEMRLQLKKGKNNCSVIDDSYSNDMASLQIALNFLQQQNQHAHKTLILTDFVGVSWTDKLKEKLVQQLREMSFTRLIFLGPSLAEIARHFDGEVMTFDDTAALIAAIPTIVFKDETILIKGARKYQLEQVVGLLVQKSHDTVLEINLKSIEHNLAQYRSKMKPGVKLMTMVKAFSYGSGSFEVANILQFNKVDYLTVAFVDEGVELRQGGISLPIMVLSPHEGTFEDLWANQLEPEIYSVRILRAFVAFLKAKNATAYPIHIKLDTGMHRLGFMPEEMDELLVLLGSSPEVRVRSTFSHFVGAGDPAFDEFSEQQSRLFREQSRKLQDSLGYQVLRHICNTNGIVHRPQDQLDMVRLGIGLYGVDMAPKGLVLQEVSTLKTTISQIKHLKEGETVGYDRKGLLLRDSVIATVKIGYADGYNRRFGNGVGQMHINGALVPTVGNICMDMCMLDITDIAANEGDEVTVFPDIKAAAQSIGTIPYELLTGISSRVKRIYYYE